MRVKRFFLVPTLLIVLLLAGCDVGAEPTPTAEAEGDMPKIAIVSAETEVVAEGRVVPVESVSLALPVGGRAAEVLVDEGDEVVEGQVLLRLDDTQQEAAVAQARAALKAARADLAKVQAGARAQEIASAEAAVESARAGLAVAEAQLASAESGIAQAQGQVAQAQAQYADLRAGATEEEIEIARLAVEQAQNSLWGAQAARDGVAGQVDSGRAPDYRKDEAEAQVGVAWVAQQIAEQELKRAQAGPRAATLAAAQAAVDIAQASLSAAQGQQSVAQAQVESARAAVAQAQAQADLVKAGATEEDIARAEAAVTQAEANLYAAETTLADRCLVSPIAGTVAALNVKAGEQVAPATVVAQVADLSEWRIETDDLTEIEVVQIEAGDEAAIVPDALPDLKLNGTVREIRSLFEEKRGDVTYTVRLGLDEADPRLRWGMTVVVSFD